MIGLMTVLSAVTSVQGQDYEELRLKQWSASEPLYWDDLSIRHLPDSLEEYARKKQRLLAGIADLQQKAAAALEEAQAAQLDPVAFRKKVLDVLAVLQSPDATEALKGEALRSIVSYIVYNKPAQRLEVYFYC